jgi:hypothetical protein
LESHFLADDFREVNMRISFAICEVALALPGLTGPKALDLKGVIALSRGRAQKTPKNFVTLGK